MIEAESAAAADPAGTGVRGCCGVDNDFLQVFLVAKWNYLESVLREFKVVPVVNNFFGTDVRFFRISHIGFFIRDDNLCNGERRKFYLYLISIHIVLNVQNFDVAAVLGNGIDNGALIIYTAALQRNDRIFCAGTALVGECCCDSSLVVSLNGGENSCLGEILGFGFHQCIAECAALSVVVRVEVESGFHIGAFRKCTPVCCKVYSLICECTQRLSFCDGRNNRLAGVLFVGNVGKIVLCQRQLCTGIILFNGLLHSGQERKILSEIGLEPAFLLVVRVVQASCSLQDALIGAAILCIIVNVHRIQKASAVGFLRICHLFQVEIHVPSIIIFDCIPFRIGILRTVSGLNAWQDSPKRRTIYLCVRVDALDDTGKCDCL